MAGEVMGEGPLAGRPFTRRMLRALMSVGRHKLRSTQDRPRIELRARNRTENSVKHIGARAELRPSWKRDSTVSSSSCRKPSYSQSMAGVLDLQSSCPMLAEQKRGRTAPCSTVSKDMCCHGPRPKQRHAC
ncbi:hypothetical protein GQ53DRAFT_847307 [Thozetella sp. PMI_491]|nr:hypothetical protein GQ53DRAFT_847307 [Thozetella sp. PMI_491]